MPKENNKVDINKHEIDIDTLKKQNVNDLLSIKEIYSKLEELGEKITQIKYIDNTLAKKLKKEYEKLEKIILDENIQVQLDNKIDEFNIKLTKDIETINSQLNNDIETINSQLDTNTNNIIGVSVINYGAKGDGVTDDTQSFKQALAENSIVYIPDGNFLISDSLWVYNNKELKGSGKNCKLIIKSSFDIIKIGYKAKVSNFVIDTTKCVNFNNNIFTVNEKTLKYWTKEGNDGLQSIVDEISVYTTTGGSSSTVICLSMEDSVNTSNGFYDLTFSNIKHVGYNNGFKYFLRNYCRNNKWITGITLTNCTNHGTEWGIFDGENENNLNDKTITSNIDKLIINNYQHQCKTNTKGYLYARNGEKIFIGSVNWDWHITDTDFKGRPMLLNENLNYPVVWSGIKVNIDKLSILKADGSKFNLSWNNKTLQDKYISTTELIVPKIFSMSNYAASNSSNDVKAYLIYRGTKLKNTNEQLIFNFRTRTSRKWIEICVYPTINNSELKFSLSNVSKLPYGFELRWRKNNNNIEVYMCSNIDNRISLYDLIKSEPLSNSQSCYSYFSSFTNFYVTFNNYNNEYLSEIPSDLILIEQND